MPHRSRDTLFFRNAEQVLTLAGRPVPRRGKSLSDLGIVPQGAVITQEEKVLAVGPTRSLERHALRLKARPIDCRGSVIIPGFIDSHTHLVFAGSRVEDYERRLRGMTYEQVARAGGGIRLSSRKIREASVNGLVSQAERFLRDFVACGTTTVEVKSGYGLDAAQELKILEALRRLQRNSPIELVPTLLAAHALPARYAGRRREYLNQIAKRLVPVVARGKLAEFIDCFCDRGAFSVEECRRILTLGSRLGLVPRIHAEQLSRTGASRLAVEVSAASADHLDQLSAADIRALAGSDTVATLLPGSNFDLGLKAYPPALKLIDAGAIVALATDFNPGTSPTPNMQFILSVACSAMRMTPAEAISAATINAAYSLRRANRLGSLEPGKQADLAWRSLSWYSLSMPHSLALADSSTAMRRSISSVRRSTRSSRR